MNREILDYLMADLEVELITTKIEGKNFLDDLLFRPIELAVSGCNAVTVTRPIPRRLSNDGGRTPTKSPVISARFTMDDKIEDLMSDLEVNMITAIIDERKHLEDTTLFKPVEPEPCAAANVKVVRPIPIKAKLDGQNIRPPADTVLDTSATADNVEVEESRSKTCCHKCRIL